MFQGPAAPIINFLERRREIETVSEEAAISYEMKCCFAASRSKTRSVSDGTVNEKIRKLKEMKMNWTDHQSTVPSEVFLRYRNLAKSCRRVYKWRDPMPGGTPSSWFSLSDRRNQEIKNEKERESWAAIWHLNEWVMSLKRSRASTRRRWKRRAHVKAQRNEMLIEKISKLKEFAFLWALTHQDIHRCPSSLTVKFLW